MPAGRGAVRVPDETGSGSTERTHHPVRRTP